MKSVFVLLFATVSAVQLNQRESFAPMDANLVQLPGDPPVKSAKEAQAAKDAKDEAKIVVEAVQPGNKTPQQDADDKAAHHAKVSKENEADMGSSAAIWAGSGAPPQITSGDTAAMAAPRPGFDASLNPGWKVGGHDSIESSNTSAVAARHAAALVQLSGAAPVPSAKEAQAAKDAKAEAKVVVEGVQPENMTPQQNAADKEAKHAKVSSDNDIDMGSNAAIWAGPGAPPQITAGDTATIAAARPGFDSSLNPGWKVGGHDSNFESSHTVAVAARHA